MATSGTYDFSSPESEQLIVEAYERIGILRPEIVGQKVFTAERSINLMLNSWINRGLNLFTIKLGLIGLISGKNVYDLPVGTSDVLEACLRTTRRNLGGTAFSNNGGIASNAFDGNPQTACVQTAPNGYISYSWGAAQYAISMVGIQSNATLNYTLSLEYSLDGNNWVNALSIPIQTYTQGKLEWFIIPVPNNGNQFRVRETGGATLNIQELFFNNGVNDTPLEGISRTEWIKTSDKNNKSSPSSFWVNRQINPNITFYPVPTDQDKCIFYSRIQQIQDIGTLVNTPDIPARFLDACCCDLSYRLGMKNPQTVTESKLSELKSLAQESYSAAAREDVERVPLRIYPDYQQGWGRVS